MGKIIQYTKKKTAKTKANRIKRSANVKPRSIRVKKA